MFVSTTTIWTMMMELVNVTKTIMLPSTVYVDESVAMTSSSLVTLNTVDAINSKTTSKHRRSLTSAYHDTMTSRVVGYVAIISVVTPVVLIVLSDTITVYQHFRNNRVSNNSP